MNLSDLSIRNPVFAVMLAAAMVIFGYLGYRDMGVSQFPEIDFPVVSITITREGAPPDIMDGDVTDVVEDAVSGVEGDNYLMSRSLESTSIVTVYFHLSRNIRIYHDAFKMTAYNISAEDLQSAFVKQHAEMPAGYIQSKLTESNLRTMGEAYSMKEMDNILVGVRGNQPIYLKDVAVLVDGDDAAPPQRETFGGGTRATN